jgi:antitoxin component YwqK of YwqJK toxin-antitoxin module
MKKTLFFLLCLILQISIAFAQNKKTKSPKIIFNDYNDPIRASWIAQVEKTGESWLVKLHDKGNVLQEEIQFKDEKLSVKEGEYKRYKAGKLYLKGNYVNNNKEGLWHYFDSDGRLSEEVSYSNSIYHGNRTTFWPNEKIKRIERYVNGYLHGPSNLYHQNGQLASQKNYIKNKVQPGFKFMDDQGKPTDSNKIARSIDYPGGMMAYYNNLSKGLLNIMSLIDDPNAYAYTYNAVVRYTPEGEIEDIEFIELMPLKLQKGILNTFRKLKNMAPATEFEEPIAYVKGMPLRFTSGGEVVTGRVIQVIRKL